MISRIKVHSQFTPIYHSVRRDAEGSTIKVLHFPLIWGTKNMPERTILCCITDLSHLPPPYGKMYCEERKGAHDGGWKLLPWHCRRSESGWLGLNFNHQVPALPCGKGEFTGLIAELLFERDLQKMSLASYIDLRNLKDMNMKVGWWKKHILQSRFLREGSPEGKTGFFSHLLMLHFQYI